MKSCEILICGDFYLGRASGDDDTGFFNDFLEDIRRASVAIVNLEAPETDSSTPISKTGPPIRSSANSVRILADAGFNVVTLATNHIMDFGKQGLKDTLDKCAANDIASLGAGMSASEAARIYYAECNGVRLAFLNFSENEFSTTRDQQPGANPLDPVQNYYKIREARSAADHVFVIVHGGHEMHPLPSPRMKSTYRFFIDAGADAVIGHHTHCYSGYEVYRDKPIFYSLGNFLFEWPGTHTDAWHSGYAVRFIIDGSRPAFEIVPYYQNKDIKGVRKMNDNERAEFDKNIQTLNRIIADDDMLATEFYKYCDRFEKLYKGFLEPHSSRVLQALQNRGFLKSLVAKRKRTLLLNLIRCESHRDIVLKILTDEDRNTRQK